MKVFRSNAHQKKIMAELAQYNDKVVGTTCIKATELMRKFINEKMKMYDHIFVVIRNISRIMMLNFKLKLPVHRDIFNPIVITEIGIIMSITGIFKIWMKERRKNAMGRNRRLSEIIKTMPRVQ